MQSKSGNKGHRRKTCLYHNLDLSLQGYDHKTMIQESMQRVRKFRSIQQDKLRYIDLIVYNLWKSFDLFRTLPTFFLSNYILVSILKFSLKKLNPHIKDYSQNLKRLKQQEKTLSVEGKLLSRDPLTYRAVYN